MALAMPNFTVPAVMVVGPVFVFALDRMRTPFEAPL